MVFFGKWSVESVVHILFGFGILRFEFVRGGLSKSYVTLRKVVYEE